MIFFSIIDPLNDQVDEDVLIHAAETALAHQSVNKQNVDLSIVIDDNAGLQDLNREYREIDSPTDVLSFTLNEKDPETDRLYLGDVIISFELALEQANKAGHPVMAELQLLTVHGVLHLLGQDHAEAEEKSKMWADQREILTMLKVEISHWPED